TLRKFCFMKRFLTIVVILIMIFGVWWIFFKKKDNVVKIKEQPLTVHAHSTQFNSSVSAALNSYFDIKSAFVDWDTLKAKENGNKFLTLMDSIKTDELKTDTTAIYQSAIAQIEDIKTNAVAMLKESNITEMRQDFRMISENL